MSISYVRRYRMELDIRRSPLAEPLLPGEYTFTPWSRSVLTSHGNVKYHSFQAALDSQIFPCLGTMAGCHRLMQEIALHDSFIPEATWLISLRTEDAAAGFFGAAESVPCATIQGLGATRSSGSIQNVGVLPRHRGLGLGRSLVLKSLHGFRARKLKRVYLEVTAENTPAVELYHSIGFRIVRTMYKAIECEPAGVC